MPLRSCKSISFTPIPFLFRQFVTIFVTMKIEKLIHLLEVNDRTLILTGKGSGYFRRTKGAQEMVFSFEDSDGMEAYLEKNDPNAVVTINTGEMIYKVNTGLLKDFLEENGSGQVIPPEANEVEGDDGEGNNETEISPV